MARLPEQPVCRGQPLRADLPAMALAVGRSARLLHRACTSRRGRCGDEGGACQAVQHQPPARHPGHPDVERFPPGRLSRGSCDRRASSGAIGAILLVITSFGILGLTSYWVAQRRRASIRRALGATRGAILRYYQLENLLIAAAGSLLGVGFAVAANLWLLREQRALSRLPFLYPLVGVAAMLVIGQVAVLWPAARASAVPPAEATRTV